MRSIPITIVVTLLMARVGHGQKSLDITRDSAVFQAAADAFRAAQVMPRIWPGFWERPSFALVRPDTVAFLFTAAPPPEEFAVVVSDGLPPELRGRSFYRLGGIPGFRGGVVPLNPAVEPLTMVMSASRPKAHLAQYVLHESFHGWQVRHQEGMFSATPQTLAGIQIPSDYAERIPQERVFLSRALATSSVDSMRLWLSRYLASRDARFKEIGDLGRDVERSQERIEGIANFVGAFGELMVTDTTDSGQRSLVLAQVQDDIKWSGGAAQPQAEQLRARVYVSGFAMAYFLARLQCAGWQNSITAGSHLDDVIRDCIRK